MDFDDKLENMRIVASLKTDDIQMEICLPMSKNDLRRVINEVFLDFTDVLLTGRAENPRIHEYWWMYENDDGEVIPLRSVFPICADIDDDSSVYDLNDLAEGIAALDDEEFLVLKTYCMGGGDPSLRAVLKTLENAHYYTVYEHPDSRDYSIIGEKVLGNELMRVSSHNYYKYAKFIDTEMVGRRYINTFGPYYDDTIIFNEFDIQREEK